MNIFILLEVLKTYSTAISSILLKSVYGKQQFLYVVKIPAEEMEKAARTKLTMLNADCLYPRKTILFPVISPFSKTNKAGVLGP